MNTNLFPVYEFRPDMFKDYYRGDLLRWNNGNPIDDDGEYDVAFITKNDVFVFMVELPYQKNILWKWCLGMRWGAFVSSHPSGNAWHYMLREGENEWGGDWGRGKHPNSIAGDKAMSWLSSRRGCANGRHVEFNVIDKTINAGLLRNAETKEVVTVPKEFNCMYCGKYDWKKEDADFIAEQNYRMMQ